jgi:TolB-like protein/Flp pilus assembly protein TadD
MPGTAGAEGALPLPDKPSIAVLPFNNMSGDPEQEYFADGIAEDVITELSRFRDLFVIGRNSTFTYKGQAVNLQKVGRELGVGYLVEGSVRKAGNRVRVTAQLIHAESGNHLWAERYDRDLTDIFAVQDEITRNVVSAIAPGVLAAEDASGRRKAPENLNAWACVVRGNARMWNIRREDFEAASALFDQAISLDPNYARARSAKAFLTVWRAFQGWSVRTSEDVAQALASARRALALDANDSMAHHVLGFVHTLGRHPDLALDALRSAIELNPNSAEAHFALGMALAYAGETEAALEALDTARQLNPRGLFDANITAFQAIAHLLSGRDEEAARLAAQSIEDRPDFLATLLVQAAGLAHLDRMEEARDAAAKVMQMIPKFSLAKHERWTPIVRAEQRARYLEGLRKAGLPE